MAAYGGAESDAVGDEYVAAFQSAPDARRKRRSPLNAPCVTRSGRGVSPCACAWACTPGRRRSGTRVNTGLDVVRTARITTSGHGGQILVSADCASAVEGLALRRLGEFWLPGLTQPEQIHQLLADDLPRDFPPLRKTISTLGAGITVVLADDAVLLREGVARLLTDSGFDVVGQSGDAEGLLRHVAMHQPTVAVVDIRMPPTHTDEGLRAARGNP